MAERLPGAVKGLSAVSLFNDFSSEMIYPVLPAFITQTLGGSPVLLGALDGAAELTASLVKWVSGRLSDRPGWAKPLILVGYGVAILIRPVISVASAAWQVVGFRVIDRVGKGLRSPPRDALISTLSPGSLRGQAFGLNRAADHGGAVLGSLVAWWMLRGGFSVRDVIGASAIPGAVAIITLALVLRLTRASTGAAAGKQDSAGSSGADARGAAFWGPVAVLVLLAVGRLPETLLLLRLQDLGVPVPMIPLAWAALHVVRSASSYPGGWLTDRLGPRPSLALGTLLYAVVVVLLSSAGSVTVGVALFLGYGLVAGLSEPPERVAVAKLAPKRTGAGFGTYQGVAGLAALPVGLLFGEVYHAAGGPAALLASALVLALAIPAWLFVSKALSSSGFPRSRSAG